MIPSVTSIKGMPIRVGFQAPTDRLTGLFFAGDQGA